MNLKYTVFTAATATVLLGSLGFAVLTTTNPAQANNLIAQAQQPNRPQGNGPGLGPQGNCQGQGPRGQHLATAAAQLGVTEAALRTALGIPAERPQHDFAAAAAQLGTTEDELRDSMRNAMQQHRQSQGQGQGPHSGPPDFTAVAQQYGVTEAEFRAILGIPDRPNLAEAAADLGVTEAELQEALQSAHGGRGPGRGQGAGMM